MYRFFCTRHCDDLVEHFSSMLEQRHWEKVYSAISEWETELANNRFIEE